MRIAGINGGSVGGQAQSDGDTTDGTVVIRVAGSATPQGLRRQLDSAVVRRILDSSHGTARYAVALTVRSYGMEVHGSSDLTGLAIDLPEPLSKAASDSLPLRVDLVPGPAAPPLPPPAPPPP